MQTHPPLKSGQIRFLVPIEALCSETDVQTIFRFLIFPFNKLFIFWD